MTQEDKDLLKRDLCSRLPYDVIISVNDGRCRKDVKLHPHYIFDWDAERWDAKPYLRPMSSITDEEKKEYDVMSRLDDEYAQPYDSAHLVDWLNEHHFDYRGLIEKGLVLEAPKEMYLKTLNDKKR